MATLQQAKGCLDLVANRVAEGLWSVAGHVTCYPALRYENVSAQVIRFIGALWPIS